jgi:succinyl-CoA synthetase alpha subunit
MGILLDQNTSIVLQGACTRRGQQLLDDMLNYNSVVAAGVCYRGPTMRVYRGVPFFRSLRQAVAEFPEINTSVIAVPPYDVLGAAQEAMECGVRLVVVHTADIPIKDVIRIRRDAERWGALLLGPNADGIVTADVAMAGSLGGTLALAIHHKGPIGIISRSNGIVNELSTLLKESGLGVSTIVTLGTERILFSSFVDILKLFASDDETHGVLLFGEPGGAYEAEAAEWIRKNGYSKPIVAYIAGRFIDDLPEGTILGHRGVVIERGLGSPSDKIRRLREAGVHVVDYVERIPAVFREVLGYGTN